MSDEPSRFPAVIAYIPVLGWLYVFFLQRQNPLAVYHLRQSIGLFLFLAAVVVGWGAVAWVLAWIPLMMSVGMALFAVVMAACFFGLIAWLIGLSNALSNRISPLPAFGRWANRLPIR
ncbi:MAG: hypothetical protein K8J31_08135 [Anaerolineae bacterium]|nr:hypothetical protein [Anaerolineae bacterium]